MAKGGVVGFKVMILPNLFMEPSKLGYQHPIVTTRGQVHFDAPQ